MLAQQRVDNMAAGWLGTGARTVFAYGEQLFVKSLKALFDPTTDYDMEDVFRIAPPAGHVGEYWGWVGWDPRKLRLRAYARRHDVPRSRPRRTASIALSPAT